MTKEKVAAPGVSGVRTLIEQGLASYGRGQIDLALQTWHEALAIEPGNEEARRLITVVADRRAQNTAAAKNDDQSGHPGNPGHPNLEQTAEWMLPTGHVSSGNTPVPPRERRTPASGIPALLAKGTTPLPVPLPAAPSEAPTGRRDGQPARPEAAAPASPSPAAPDALEARAFKEPTRSTFAPLGTNTNFPPAVPEPVVDVLTRPIGIEKPSPAQPAGHTARTAQTFRSDTPLDLALTIARTRAVMLVDECRRSLAAGEVAKAAAAAEEALEEGDKAPMPGIIEVIAPARAMFSQAFEMHVGPEVGVPVMAVDVSAASAASFDHRTGFLLSCIDGTLPVQTLLDIAGMGRFDSLRALSGLLRRRIIKF